MNQMNLLEKYLFTKWFIFTISSLRYFLEDEYIKEYIGKIVHTEMVIRMDIINEDDSKTWTNTF